MPAIVIDKNSESVRFSETFSVYMCVIIDLM